MIKTLSFTLKIDREQTTQLVSQYLIMAEMITEKERPYLVNVSCENGVLLAEYNIEIQEKDHA